VILQVLLSSISLNNVITFLVVALPPSLNFLTVTGEFSEGQILTASYGYIGGHEGNSLYSWHLHEVCIVVSWLSIPTDT